MKSLPKYLLLILAPVLGYPHLLANSIDKPNIIVIFIDDMGYADIGPLTPL